MGIIIGVKGELKEVEESKNEMKEEDLMERKTIINAEKWRILTAYSKGMEQMRKKSR